MENRQIKFRAWDTYTKNMVDWDCMLAHWNLKAFEQPYHVFMQYTGLKDKNGKEIYEGDVVRVYGENRLVEFKHAFWSQIDLGGFGTQVTEDDGHTYFKPLYRYGNIEVLGNIHEHPHLLTQPDDRADSSS